MLELLKPASINVSRQLTIEDLHVIEVQARQYNLLPLIYDRLASIGPDAGKNCIDFLNRLKPLYLGNVARVIRQKTVRDDLLNLLAKEELSACPLKGSAIAQEIFGNIGARASADIDILVKEQDIHRVDNLLSVSGFRTCESLPLGFLLTRTHHALYQHTNSGEYVEIHWNFGVPSFFNLSSSDIWKEITPDQNGLLKLSNEMLLIQTIIHHFMHAFRDLKILVDVLWILGSYNEVIDWPRLAVRLKHLGLVRATTIALDQLRDLWPDKCASLPAYTTLTGILQKKHSPVTSALLSYFRMELKEPSHKISLPDGFMQRFALDRCSTTCYAFIKTLFPLPKSIKAFYSDQRNLMLPLYYLRFFGWRIKEWLL